MSIVMCDRCDKYVDLDFHSDDMIVLPGSTEFICWTCLTMDEQEELEIREATQ